MIRRVTLVGLIEAACFLIVFGTLAGFFGGWSWILELFDHFRLHYLFGAVALGGLAWWTTRHRWALACLVVFFINLYLCPAVLPIVTRPPATDQHGAQVRVATINVLTSNRNHGEALSLIREQSPDVLLLIETDGFWWVGLADLLEEYRVIKVELRSDNFGMALLVKHAIAGEGRIMYHGTMNLPAIHASLVLPDGRAFDVLGLHPTPPAGMLYRDENRRMLEDASRMINELSGPVIVLGDLNLTPWSKRFRSLLRTTGLVDTSRFNGYLATWPTAASPVLRIPLDHCLITPDIAVTKRWLGNSFGSDHLPLFVDLDIPPSAHVE